MCELSSSITFVNNSGVLSEQSSSWNLYDHRTKCVNKFIIEIVSAIRKCIGSGVSQSILNDVTEDIFEQLFPEYYNGSDDSDDEKPSSGSSDGRYYKNIEIGNFKGTFERELVNNFSENSSRLRTFSDEFSTARNARIEVFFDESFASKDSSREFFTISIGNRPGNKYYDITEYSYIDLLYIGVEKSENDLIQRLFGDNTLRLNIISIKGEFV